MSSKTHSRLWVGLAVLVGLVIGVGAAALFFRQPDSDPPAEEPAALTGSETRDGDAEAAAELPEPDQPVEPDDATDPETALRSYLANEASGDWEASYQFLTPELREVAYSSPAFWVASHADFPTVTGYRIDDVQTDEQAGTATVSTLTGFEPKLDPVLGLVAARGRSQWALEQNDEGLWRVNVAESTNRPLFPDSSGAAEAVRAWVDARVACEETTEMESGLVGNPAQARLLCEEAQDPPVEIGPIGPLTDSADTAPLLAEFGPEVFNWARTARVDAATPIEAVLAPIGTEWRVVAVLPG